MDKRRQILEKIIREAGSLLAKNFGKRQSVKYKGDVHLVTAMDHASEDLILQRLKENFPDDDILTEEREQKPRQSENLWIVDPLDATNNYAHGFPFFCVSIALEQRDQMKLGAILDPLRDALYIAELGQGSSLNGSPIRVSDTADLNRSLVATGFPYDKRESSTNNLDYFQKLALRVQGIRRTGSAALDLAYVATGRLDGYWELKLSPWDVAAGTLLVLESGGHVSDFSGKNDYVYSGEVVASNGRIQLSMLTILA